MTRRLRNAFAAPMLEAIACECPAVATRLGRVDEVAADAAEFASGGDDRELANALLRASQDRARS